MAKSDRSSQKFMKNLKSFQDFVKVVHTWKSQTSLFPALNNF